MRNFKSCLICACLLVLFVSLATAAERTGTFVGFLGLNHVSKDNGDHVILGGQGIVDLTKNYSLYAEIGITPMKNSTGSNFDGGVVINFPQKNEQYKPYIIGGLGLGHINGANSFLLGGGGGVRIYIKPKSPWGISPEFRVVRLTGYEVTAVMFTGGIFYDFKR